MLRISRIALALVLLVALSNCIRCGQVECQVAADCPEWKVGAQDICEDGYCSRPDCTSNRHCGDGQYCSTGKCIELETPFNGYPGDEDMDVVVEQPRDMGTDAEPDADMSPSAPQWCLTSDPGVCADDARTTAARYATTPGPLSAGTPACNPQAIWQFDELEDREVRYVSTRGDGFDELPVVSLWDAVSGLGPTPRVASLTPQDFVVENPIVVMPGTTLALVSPCWQGTVLELRQPIVVEEGATLHLAGVTLKSSSSLIEVNGGHVFASGAAFTSGTAAIQASRGSRVSIVGSVFYGSGSAIELDGAMLYASGVWFDRVGTAISASSQQVDQFGPFDNIVSLANSRIDVPAEGKGVDADASAITLRNSMVRAVSTEPTQAGLELYESVAGVFDSELVGTRDGVRAVSSRVVLDTTVIEDAGWGVSAATSPVATTFTDDLYHDVGAVFAPESDGDFGFGGVLLPGDQRLPGDSLIPASFELGEILAEHYFDGAGRFPNLLVDAPELAELDRQDAFPAIILGGAEITRAQHAGIAARDVNLVILDSEITGAGSADSNSPGIFVDDVRGAWLRRATVTGNGGWGGALLQDSVFPLVIDDSDFSGNTAGGLAVYGAPTGSVTIDRTLFAGNSFGLAAVDVTTFEGNSLLVRGNSSHGVAVLGSFEATLGNSTVTDNGGYGLVLVSVESMALFANDWSGNAEGAIGSYDVGNVSGNDPELMNVTPLTELPTVPGRTRGEWLDEQPSIF